jgi:hypothetical protein
VTKRIAEASERHAATTERIAEEVERIAEAIEKWPSGWASSGDMHLN